jgi:hypothetical protein
MLGPAAEYATPRNSANEEAREATPEETVRQTCANLDPVEAALAAALSVAAGAGDVGTVAKIVELLRTRHVERAGVVDLAQERAKR